MSNFNSSDYLFGSAAVLPEQFFPERPKLDEPIERLMLAVLIDAIRCYQTNLGARRSDARRLLAETKEWLFRMRGDALFSFESICGVLQIDAPGLRRALLRWHDQKLAGRQPPDFSQRSSVTHRKGAERTLFPDRRDSAA